MPTFTGQLDELLTDQYQNETNDADPGALSATSSRSREDVIADSVDRESAAETLPNTEAARGTPRRRGQRKPSLDDESTPQVLKVGKSLVRTDWAGRDPDEAIQEKAQAEGLDLGPLTRAFVRRLVEAQVEGCRRRILPRLDEAIRRLEGTSPQESAK